MTSLIAATAVGSVEPVEDVVVRAAGVGATRPRVAETTLARLTRPVNAANAKARRPIARRRIGLQPPAFFAGGGDAGVCGAVMAGSGSFMRIASRVALRVP